MEISNNFQYSCSSLQDLIHQLRSIFDSDHVDIDHVKDLLNSYKSNPADWRQFAKFDTHKYTRNLVDEGNGKYNLMILCWGEGMGSSIHDHSDAHCFVKILEGLFRETLYDWPVEEGDVPKKRCVNLYEKNQVTYINDTIGLHRMENPSHVEGTVTMHLYCPPFDHCRAFDERTGHTMVCPVTFWSKYGEKVDNGFKKPISAATSPKTTPRIQH